MLCSFIAVVNYCGADYQGKEVPEYGDRAKNTNNEPLL